MSLPPISNLGRGAVLSYQAGGNAYLTTSAYQFSDKQGNLPLIVYCTEESATSNPNSPLQNLLNSTNKVLQALVHLGAGSLGLAAAFFISHKFNPKLKK